MHQSYRCRTTQGRGVLPPCQHPEAGVHVMAIKERDVVDRIKNMGFERGVAFILLEHTGEISQIEKALVSLAKQVDQMAELMAQFVAVAGNMKDAHQQV